ncbi:uncharacterized protein LOC120354693 [Nilaparvata lugens]|uniref:uncharacterized protein LOC120354693 n=1 Tax=Nilaparvata lugens TaxID=108931 RepID=UPI00193DE07B|nr:uncharacterized protein LOC120354693 [Nilaparvata lugens]
MGFASNPGENIQQQANGDDGENQHKTYKPDPSGVDSSEEDKTVELEDAVERPRKRQHKGYKWNVEEYKDHQGNLHAAKKFTKLISADLLGEELNSDEVDQSRNPIYTEPSPDKLSYHGLLGEVFNSNEVDQPRNRTYTELSPVKFSNVTSDEIDHQLNFTSTEIVQNDLGLLVENAASNSDLDPYTSAEILIQDGNLDFQAEKTVTTTSRKVSQVGDLNFLTVDVSENREIIEAIDMDFYEIINIEHTDISQLSSFNVPNQDRDTECVAEETLRASDCDNYDEDYLPSRSDSEDSEVEVPRKRKRILLIFIKKMIYPQEVTKGVILRTVK